MRAVRSGMSLHRIVKFLFMVLCVFFGTGFMLVSWPLLRRNTLEPVAVLRLAESLTALAEGNVTLHPESLENAQNTTRNVHITVTPSITQTTTPASAGNQTTFSYLPGYTLFTHNTDEEHIGTGKKGNLL